ncbi:MAG: type II secretion system F family protein [Rhodocyclaceae bacterium]|nr:type II secretion system F family protein [Rhodocyclaceae bacterium]
MELYEYKGRNKHGDVMTGTIESASPDAVADWLLGSGIAPVSIQVRRDAPSSQPEWLTRIREYGMLGLRDRLLFTRQMTTMVRAGVPMIQALASIQKSTQNVALIRILRGLRGDLEKGLSLSQAMARHPSFFDDYYVAMVRVGENSGALEEIFRRLFDQLQFEGHMQKKIKSAVRYPAFVITAIAIAVGILTVFVIPAFAKFFDKFNAQLPLATRVLLKTSEFAVNYWYLVILGILAVFILFRAYVNQKAGRYQWDKLKLRIPIAGPIIKKATLARFCRSLSTASRSGVPLVQAFTLVSRVVNNAFYEERILQMRAGIERGDSICASRKLRRYSLPSNCR